MLTTYGELDTRSGVPLYRQIKEILRDEIAKGSAVADLPLTEAQLLARFGVSRAPIRQALAELSAEGYVYRRAGKGTFPISGVRLERPAEPKPGYLYEYLDGIGSGATLSVSEPDRVTPSERLRKRLGVDAREQLLHFAHRIVLDGRALIQSELYIRAPRDFAPTASELEAEGSAFELLERRFDIALERSEHEAWAASATLEQARSFAVPTGSPLLAIDTVFYATGGVPMGFRSLMHQTEDIRFRFTTRM